MPKKKLTTQRNPTNVIKPNRSKTLELLAAIHTGNGQESSQRALRLKMKLDE